MATRLRADWPHPKFTWPLQTQRCHLAALPAGTTQCNASRFAGHRSWLAVKGSSPMCFRYEVIRIGIALMQ